MAQRKRLKARRRKMHPTRRRQETLGFAGILGSCVMLLAGGLWMVTLGCVTLLGSSLTLLASRASPPPTKKSRDAGTPNTAPKDARVRQGTIRVGITGRERGRRGNCTAACQYSRKSRTTCQCPCGGSTHGISAPRAGGRQGTKPKPATRKRPAKKRG